MKVHCAKLILAGSVEHNLGIEFDPDGSVISIQRGEKDTGGVALGTAVPGFVNTHSHAFQRLLRGRTNSGGGDFWVWRREMYAAADTLSPAEMFAVAKLVYEEMRAAGYTSVGEFHYVHHQPDGTAYPKHDMEAAICEAARIVGIRLTLLDTCYLAGGFGRTLAAGQQRFSDGTAESWLERWHSLRDMLSELYPEVTLGAALHSVRAVPAEAMKIVVEGVPHDVPLHVHVSEQVAENEESVSHSGLTPTELLASVKALSERTTVIHATHLTPADVALLGENRVSVGLCPSTEADLGDGLGVPEELDRAGAHLTVGSDQNGVIDPFAEVRGVEWMARLRLQRRGIFAPAKLWEIGTANGCRSLGREGDPPQGLELGRQLDLVEIRGESSRNFGAREHELILTAAAGDVVGTVIRGEYRKAIVNVPAPVGLWRQLTSDG